MLSERSQTPFYTAPLSLKTYMCTKSVSMPSLVRSNSQLLSLPLFASVLKQPDAAHESLRSWAASLIPSCDFHASAILNSSYIHQGGGCHSGMAGFGAGLGTVFGSLITGYARNFFLRLQLFSCAILGFSFSDSMGLFCLMVVFPILFTMLRSPLHHSWLFLPCLICSVCSFSYISLGRLEKAVSSGFGRGRTNKYHIKKRQKKIFKNYILYNSTYIKLQKIQINQQ